MAHAIELQSSPRATAPAQPATHTRLQRFGTAVWNVLEAVGQRRAARQLELLARSVEADRPELARQFREAARNPIAS